MHQAEKLNIRIVDTIENSRQLIFENTSVESPRLLWNGQDDKFANLNTSELVFNMLVTSADEGVFFHLFTGLETRFKIYLEDITDAQNVKVLWTGFLLPEQFSEPFINKNFFVEFVATDGIGRLKNQVLPNDFYRDHKSILEVINRCLTFTGLKLNVLFAPAIQNTGFDISYQELEVNTASYLEGEDKKSVYDVLVDLLTSIGCKLFQYNNQWMIIGINRINHTTILFKKYAPDAQMVLKYVEDVTLERSILNNKFFATPTISIVPPLQSVTTTWNHNNDTSLVPADIITHLPKNLVTDVADETVLYWQKKGSKNFTFKVWQYAFSNYQTVNNLLQYKSWPVTAETFMIKVDQGPYVYFDTYGETLTVADLATNYVNLETPFYIEKSKGDENLLSLKISFHSYLAKTTTVDELKTLVKDKDLDSHFFFSITKKSAPTQLDSAAKIVVSNFITTQQPESLYDFEYKEDAGKLLVALDIKDFKITDAGYYNLRIYPSVTHAKFLGVQIYKSLVLELKTGKEIKMTNTRNLNYTTSHSVDVFHSDSLMPLSKRRFSFAKSVQDKLTANTLLPQSFSLQKTFYNTTPVNQSGVLWYHHIIVGLSNEDYVRLQSGYQLYVKKPNVAAVKVALDDYVVKIDESLGGKIIEQKNYVNISSGAVYVDAVDELFCKINTDASNTVDYVGFWLDKWKRFNYTESQSYLECLNQIYHGCLKEYNLSISGSYIGLVSPFDLIEFSYKGVRRYNPVTLELNLTEGVTEVGLIESNYDDIYFPSIATFEEIVLEAIKVTPIISITAFVEEPSAFFPIWGINVFHVFGGIDPVNATLTAKQMTNTIANGGVYTGFEKTVNVTAAYSNVLVSFPFVIGAQAGYYELVTNQGGVFSNVVYVEIATNVSTPSQGVTINKIDIGNSKNTVIKYGIDYTGFTPILVKEYLQQVSVFGEVIGAPRITVISNVASEIETPNYGNGFFNLHLEADGYVSNKIGFMTLIV
ncbi:hypothetical protein OD91_0850 [Lutibacter sp. Hel_I_33_5]|uniref:hypothetical protein n=1 Tax=Lutibacter sp. Hel_I_33_5 TaxID=1566289 RepID=UPI00119F9222|nr:hypothetical protein [Lutibacter sp. Hel_I_33_5]TVZ55595.1 hypothetical protein OD91_0850 [Lutibacter sp. Hel_I_33_5]